MLDCAHKVVGGGDFLHQAYVLGGVHNLIFKRARLRLFGIFGALFFKTVAAKTFAGHFAGFCDVHKRVGIARRHDAFDAVDLLFACHAHKDVVFLAGVVADRFVDGDAAVELDGNLFCNLVGLVGDDGENKRRESAVFQKLGDF